MRQKVLFVGLDGVTFDVLDPLMDAGLMPRLKGLRESGSWGRLESVFPPITPVAWVSWMTGKNPGKHGVFEFLQKEKGTGASRPVNANSRHGVPFWDVMASTGHRSIVTNIPCTYPPRIANGILISDFLTPRGRRDFTHPPRLLDELEARFGPYPLYLTEVYSPGNVGPILDELFHELDYKTKVNSALMEEGNWDVFLTHYWGTDRFQHELWHLLDVSHPFFEAKEHRENIARVHRYWGAVDAAVGSLVDRAGEETTVFVASDHGFGPIRNFLCFNYWLLQEGLLALKRGPLTRLKSLVFRLGLTPELLYRWAMRVGLARLRLSMGVGDRSKLQRLANTLMLSLQDVDWSRTVAFSKGNYGQIHINLQGREAEGIVAPGEDYRRAIEDVTARLRGLVDPESGQPLIGPIWRREDLYRGPHSEQAPDIQFLPEDMANKALGTLDLTSNRFICPVFGNSGDHRMQGVLIAHGPRLRSRHEIQGAKLIDLAPTMLHLFGEPVPRDMDGRVLEEIFDREFQDRNQVRFREPLESSGDQQGEPLSEEEAAEIEERLKALGYLG